MPDAFDPRAFFEVLLPAMVADKGALAEKVGARVQLYLKRDDDDCAWTLDLEGPPRLRAGIDDDAAVHLSFSERAILPLLAGTLDVEAALAAADIEVEGDREVLLRLASLFDGGMSALALRLRAATGQLG